MAAPKPPKSTIFGQKLTFLTHFVWVYKIKNFSFTLYMTPCTLKIAEPQHIHKILTGKLSIKVIFDRKLSISALLACDSVILREYGIIVYCKTEV